MRVILSPKFLTEMYFHFLNAADPALNNFARADFALKSRDTTLESEYGLTKHTEIRSEPYLQPYSVTNANKFLLFQMEYPDAILRAI